MIDDDQKFTQLFALVGLGLARPLDIAPVLSEFPPLQHCPPNESHQDGTIASRSLLHPFTTPFLSDRQDSHNSGNYCHSNLVSVV